MSSFINQTYNKLEKFVYQYLNGELKDKNLLISTIKGALLKGNISENEAFCLLDKIKEKTITEFEEDDEFLNKKSTIQYSFNQKEVDVSEMFEDDEEEVEDNKYGNAFFNPDNKEDEFEDDGYFDDDEPEEIEQDNTGFFGLLEK